MVALFGATIGGYRFPAHKIGYHIGATILKQVWETIQT
jgi:hypothetical protein